MAPRVVPTLTMRALLSRPDMFLWGLRSGTIGEVERGRDILAAFEDAYLEQTGGRRDPTAAQLVQFRRAMAANDQQAMATVGGRIEQLFADKEVVLRKLLAALRRRKDVDFNDPINQLRLAIAAKWGKLYLREVDPTTAAERHAIERTVDAFHIDPLVSPSSQGWLSLLQATLYAALERSYTGHKEIFRGRDCLDRSIAWNLSLSLDRFNEDRPIDVSRREKVLFHRPSYDYTHGTFVAERGGKRHAFNHYSFYESSLIRLQAIEVSSGDLRRAKKMARNYLDAHPELKHLRFRWLKAVRNYVGEAQSNYLRGLLQSFGFAIDRNPLEGSQLLQNPDLFLLHQFLKTVLWEKLEAVLKTLVTESPNSGRGKDHAD